MYKCISWVSAIPDEMQHISDHIVMKGQGLTSYSLASWLTLSQLTMPGLMASMTLVTMTPSFSLESWKLLMRSSFFTCNETKRVSLLTDLDPMENRNFCAYVDVRLHFILLHTFSLVFAWLEPQKAKPFNWLSCKNSKKNFCDDIYMKWKKYEVK